LNPENFYDDMDDFNEARKEQGRTNYQFKAALPFFSKYDITRDDVSEARQAVGEGCDFLQALKARTQLPAWLFADRDASLKSAEHLLDLGKLLKSPAFKAFLDHTAICENLQAAQVFTVPGHGMWVLHNLGLTYRGGTMYLHVPSSDTEVADLHILKFKDFIRETATDG
jgi:hypothetical protein